MRPLLASAALLFAACATAPALPMPPLDARLSSLEEEGVKAFSVSVTGNGSVLVTPVNDVCIASSCLYPVAEGTTVRLRALADPRFHFARWEGACAGTDPECSVSLERSELAVARFERNHDDAERTAREGVVAVSSR